MNHCGYCGAGTTSNPLPIRYVARPDATPEGEAAALASVYRFLLERRAKRTAVSSSSDPKQEGGADEKLTEKLR